MWLEWIRKTKDRIFKLNRHFNEKNPTYFIRQFYGFFYYLLIYNTQKLYLKPTLANLDSGLAK